MYRVHIYLSGDPRTVQFSYLKLSISAEQQQCFLFLNSLGVRRENIIEQQMTRRSYRARERGHRCSPMTVRHFPAAVCVCLAHTQQFRPPSSQHNLIVQPPLPPTADAAAADNTTTLLSVTTATTDHRCCSASAYGVRRSVRVRPPPVEISIVFFPRTPLCIVCTGKRRRRRRRT